jgi:glyoxylase-like metal-dependent hydrolase (beta-lactamase superfamily II)
LCNGGIIAGRSAVLAIEGFFEPRGAAWLAERARELTGRWPTHVAVTHFHADHTSGVSGYQAADRSPELRATAITRDLVRDRNKAAAPQSDAWQQAIVIPAAAPSTLDLGGRTARIVPRLGHTKSDVSIEVSDPQVIFCGDLVWNAMFPNYVDAAPVALARSVRDLRGAAPAVYVPGHGALAGASEFDRYIAVLDEVERAARRAHGQGLTAAEAGARFSLPASLGEWALFNPVFFERAFTAWYKELQ